MTDFAHPEVLVGTGWVAEHCNNAGIRLAEVDVDTSAYDHGHVPGAVGWSWTADLADTVRRDILSREQFETLMSRSGIGNDATVILYGDNNNWFAAWAFWQMKVYGHPDVRIMDGGRRKWLDEGRQLETQTERPPHTEYHASEADPSLRALLPETMQAMNAGDTGLVDVRSPQEYTGEKVAPEGLSEDAQRGGHIPGAVNVPWSKVVNADGTFKPADELRALYEQQGIVPDRPVITYCRIGERSSHTWFVLKYLLGYPNVRNYDGSWTEWGNLVGMPVARGEQPRG